MLALLATTGLALSAAQCGSAESQAAQLVSSVTRSSSSDEPPAGSARAQDLAFVNCMRANGVLNYPDPDGLGDLVKESPQQLGVSFARFQSAQNACRHLLPYGGSGPNPAQLQQARAQALSFSRCIRAHGVPNFPDPDNTGRIPDPATVGINQGSPKFEAANTACEKYRPPYMPSNARYNLWARSHGG